MSCHIHLPSRDSLSQALVAASRPIASAVVAELADHADMVGPPVLSRVAHIYLVPTAGTVLKVVNICWCVGERTGRRVKRTKGTHKGVLTEGKWCMIIKYHVIPKDNYHFTHFS